MDQVELLEKQLAVIATELDGAALGHTVILAPPDWRPGSERYYSPFGVFPIRRDERMQRAQAVFKLHQREWWE